VKPGDMVSAGQVIGEVIDIEDTDAPRVQVISRATGVLFGLKRHHLVRPGQVIAKISGSSNYCDCCMSINKLTTGKDPLPWRLNGDLLTV
jgi:predicted deacylase